MVVDWFAKKTVSFRHKATKLIAPKIYSHFQNQQQTYVKCFYSGSLPRPMIVFIKNRTQKALVGAEIGVYKGDNALDIYQRLNIKKLFLIDPYSSCNQTTPNILQAKKEALSKLGGFADVRFIFEDSNVAYKKIKEPLDFIYIDGGHSYSQVRNDIKNYYPLVKRGGIIGGHDFWLYHRGLMQAVLEFSASVDLQLYIQLCDWWIEKKIDH